MRIIAEALTFDDVSLVPAESNVLPRDVSTRTRLARGIELDVPIASAAMDTVTEGRLAITMAQCGGIGIMHKNMSVERQAAEVALVKKFEAGVIRDPITVSPDTAIEDVIKLTRARNISGVPVVDGGQLVGIVTSRDFRFEKKLDDPVRNIMTRKERLVTVREGAGDDEVMALLHKHRIEKVLVVNDQFELRGLITVKDIQKSVENPNAAKDQYERLRVGAAVSAGADAEQRVAALVAAGVDVLVVDSAHGHARGVLDRVRWIKQRYPDIQVVAGNIVTGDGAKALVDAGADGVKVGIGPGSICTTRRHGRPAHRGRRHPLLRRHRQGDRRGRFVRDDRRHVRGHRGGARRSRAVPGPVVQELPRHGLARCDATRLEGSLFPGRVGRREARARGHRGPRAVPRAAAQHRAPARRRAALEHGLPRLRDDRRDAREAALRARDERRRARVARARRGDHEGSTELPDGLSKAGPRA
jgi:IMP dehydrogenase/GMP reductase